MPQTVDLRSRRSSDSPSPDVSRRIPPHNLQAEESLLGAMLLTRDAIVPAVEACSAADFYKPAHGYIFEAVLSLWSRGEPADPVTVADELTRADLLEAVGGASALVSLQANTPATSNAGRYARIVEEHALLRRLITTAGEIAELGYSVPDDITMVIDQAEALIFEVGQRRVSDTMLPIRELLSRTLDELERLYDRGESITGVPTGFHDLDERLSGLQPNSLIIVGARPAMGKCVAWDTPIVDPMSGAVRTAAEVHRLGEAGEQVDVLSLDHRHQLHQSQPSAFVDDGVKPVFSVCTALGRKVRTTLSHPFLTPQGWLPLGRLQLGTKVAVPKRIDVFGIDHLPLEELSLLAYLLSENGKTGESPVFGALTTEMADEAARCALVMGGRAIRKSNDDGSTSIVFMGQSGRSNPVCELLSRHGLMNCSSELRELPEVIFRLARPQLVAFLNRLLGASGRVIYDLEEGKGEVQWSATSERFARGMQHLLLRFGLNARLRTDGSNAYVLALEDPPEIRRFRHEIGMRGHEQELEILVSSLSVAPRSATAERVLVVPSGAADFRGASALPTVSSPTLWEINEMPSEIWKDASVFLSDDGKEETTALPTCADVMWDEIVSIAYDGDEQVFDLTVPFDHNFVAGDVIVHNTSFALNMVSHAALNGTSVLFFSLEMSHHEITQRLVCSEARVDASRLRNGRLHDTDWPKINHAIGRLGEAQIHIDDNPNLTVMDLRAKARRLKATPGGLGLVVVDYLQLMSGRNNAENRQVEVSEMSRGLKILARELQVPVVALSQLSRNLEMRADKRPTLADLRESGSLEQDADVVMFLYRDEVYSPESPDKGSAEVIISKHRNGPVGTTQLAFIDRYTRFANMARV